MQKTLSTAGAARKIGVGLRTLNRWLALGRIKPSVAVPMGGGRTLWRWADTDIAKGRKVKAAQKPGPKPDQKGRKK
ncbi:MAG: hypothetical protein WA581_09380 [Candidatus Acidiferrales bacterium]